MIKKTIKLGLKDDQEGFAAIVIALVIILVLSLVTVGFAQLMQSNQEAALSKQLSSQAYYSAESGINDASEAYASGFNVPKTNCGPVSSTTPSGYQYLNSSNVDVNSTTDTGITCLLMNPDPSSLIFGSVDNNQPIVTEMQGCATSGTASNPCTAGPAAKVGSINITWNDNSSYPLPRSCSNLLPQDAPTNYWKYQNILRIELIPVSGSGAVGDSSRDNLINNAYTAYLCPDNSGSGSYTVSSTDLGNGSGDILDSSCSGGAPPCTVSLNVGGLTDSSGNPYSAYFIVMRSIYSNNIEATITMQDTSSPPNSLDIADAQLLVDSTGKAQNVLKRVQVRIPESGRYDLPNSVEEGVVCKQLAVVPLPDTTVDVSGSNICQ